MVFFTPSLVPKESGFRLKLGSASVAPLEKLQRPDDGSWGGMGRHRINTLLRDVNRIRNKRLRSDNLDQCREGLIRMEERLESCQRKADKLEEDFEPLFIPSPIWGSAPANEQSDNISLQEENYPMGPGQLKIREIRKELDELSCLVQDYKLLVEKRREAIRKAQESVTNVWHRHHRSKANRRALSALTAWEVRKARKLAKALRRNVDPNSSPEERRLASESIRSILGFCPERSVALRSLAVITGYKRKKNQKLDYLAVLQHAAGELSFSEGKQDAYKIFFRQRRRTQHRLLKRKLREKYKEKCCSIGTAGAID